MRSTLSHATLETNRRWGYMAWHLSIARSLGSHWGVRREYTQCPSLVREKLVAFYFYRVISYTRSLPAQGGLLARTLQRRAENNELISNASVRKITWLEDEPGYN